MASVRVGVAAPAPSADQIAPKVKIVMTSNNNNKQLHAAPVPAHAKQQKNPKQKVQPQQSELATNPDTKKKKIIRKKSMPVPANGHASASFAPSSTADLHSTSGPKKTHKRSASVSADSRPQLRPGALDPTHVAAHLGIESPHTTKNVTRKSVAAPTMRGKFLSKSATSAPGTHSTFSVDSDQTKPSSNRKTTMAGTAPKQAPKNNNNNSPKTSTFNEHGFKEQISQLKQHAEQSPKQEQQQQSKPKPTKKLIRRHTMESSPAAVAKAKLSPKRATTVRKVKLPVPDSPSGNNNKFSTKPTKGSKPSLSENPAGGAKSASTAKTPHTTTHNLRKTVSNQTAANAKAARTKSVMMGNKVQQSPKRHSIDPSTKLAAKPFHAFRDELRDKVLPLEEEEEDDDDSVLEKLNRADTGNQHNPTAVDDSTSAKASSKISTKHHKSFSALSSSQPLHKPHKLSGSSYAGDIANTTSMHPASAFRPVQRTMEENSGQIPNAMGNYTDNIQHQRLSQPFDEEESDDLADPKIKKAALAHSHRHHDHSHNHRVHHTTSRSLSPPNNTTDKHSTAATPSPAIFFGAPLVPIDIADPFSDRPLKLNLMHHKDALLVLGQIKNMKRRELHVQMLSDGSNNNGAQNKHHKKDPPDKHDETKQQQQQQQELKCITLLKTSGNASSATLSMRGYKGGPLEDQRNHDRSLIVSPFYLKNHGQSNVKRRLLGVFDGHGLMGYRYAEHCQQRLPSMLSRRLSDAFHKAVDDISAGLRTGDDEVAITKRVLMETFVAMDETSPREAAGGCTSTVVYQQGHKVYIANTGDSRSCIVVYHKNQHNTTTATDPQQQKSVKVVYMSREDKPDLHDERMRLESCGGQIIAAEKNKSSKVKFNSNKSGKASSSTLSMSRSIGDWQFTTLGVIPDPIVGIVDLKEVVKNEMTDGIDDVCVFALCMSDGMMIESDQEAEALAKELAPSLFEDDAPHPLTACQNAIERVEKVWDKRNKGKFRDDMTLAISALRSPS